MNEEKEKQGTPEDADKGIQPKATTLVDEANAAAERLEKANERNAELLRQQEELMAKKALGGRSEAGQTPVKKEIDAEQYAKDVLAGKIDHGKEE